MNLAIAIPHTTRSLDTASLDSGSLDDRLSALRPTRNPVLQQLRSQYPTGCLSADLVQIHQDQFVVRAVVQVDNIALVTALASASTIEVAEDRARTRVMEALGLNSANASVSATVPIASTISSPIVEAVATLPEPPMAFADESPVAPKVETTPVSKATKRKSKAAPVVPEAVVEELSVNLFDTSIPEAAEIVEAPEFIPEPIAEISIQAVAPAVQPVVASIVEPVLPTPVLSPVVPVSVQAAVEMATEPEELESVEISFQVEEVYEYTYEGEEIPLEPIAAIELAPTPIVVPAAPIDYGLDLSDAIAQIGMEIDRIGWTKKQGSAYLQQAYGKRTRAELTETELFGFLSYLKSMPAKLQPELSQIPF
ncbi:MAG: hypothetical protein LH631_02540 [Alkalinema sp. CAN_BIN05]|nr:hypothetical protein [Alkalinema sp. CAN_BIN05]